MVIQVINITAGFLLAAPKLAQYGAKTHVEAAASALAGFRSTFGFAALAFGVIALIDRMGVLSLGLPLFGSSYPQAFPAIAIGLLLAQDDLARFAWVRPSIDFIRPFASWIGMIGMLVGVGSLVFGCVFPIVCPG